MLKMGLSGSVLKRISLHFFGSDSLLWGIFLFSCIAGKISEKVLFAAGSSAILLAGIFLIINADELLRFDQLYVYEMAMEKGVPVMLYIGMGGKIPITRQQVLDGFLFHLFWEAKSQYMYPYAFVLIPLCAYMMAKLSLFDRKVRLGFFLKEGKHGGKVERAEIREIYDSKADGIK